MAKNKKRLAALLAEWQQIIDRMLELEEEIRKEVGVKSRGAALD